MHAVALIQTDPDHAKQAFAALAGFMGIIMIFGLAMMAFMIFLFWRILDKAGMPGPLALLVLFPGLGTLIVLCVLAFGDWKVAPVRQAAYYPPPQYPPQPPTF